MEAPMLNIEGSPSLHTAVNTTAMSEAITAIFVAAKDTNMDQKTVRDALALLRGTATPTPSITVKECTFTGTSTAPTAMASGHTSTEREDFMMGRHHDVTDHGVSESNTPQQNWAALKAMIDALNPGGGGLSVKGQADG